MRHTEADQPAGRSLFLPLHTRKVAGSIPAGTTLDRRRLVIWLAEHRTPRNIVKLLDERSTANHFAGYRVVCPLDRRRFWWDFRFHLKAANGEIIASGQGYKTKAAAEKGIESVKTNAAAAKVDDHTDQEHTHS
jgi:uncharacterized protein YegP (UPF0339 family)